MNLNPALLSVMADLGITEAELAVLQGRMSFAVSSMEAQVNALDAQIAQLSQQRDALMVELAAGQITMAKLMAPAAEPAP